MLECYTDIRIKVVAPKSSTEILHGLKNVDVVSGLSDGDLLAAYREASCFLMTLEAATANNAILEAMACGLPIVSEKVGGIAEYTDAGCAMLCEPGSAEALTEAVLTLYKRPELIARMRALARHRAMELDWSLVAERTVRLYETIMEGSRRALSIKGQS
jgi:glycosyltransferase involved in cell wall biosynthesis